MSSRAIFRQRAAWALATVFSLVHPAAQACEGCKQAVGMGDGASGSRVVNGVGLGYAVSIGLLLFMVVGVILGLGFMMYRNCQAIAAYQRAMSAVEEAGEFGGGTSAGVRA